VAGHTILPVIGLPVSGGALDGVDALYATVQMPPGIPVATVGINGAKNAALLAIQMLALADDDLAQKLEAYKVTMAEKVVESDEALQSEI
jgi:5-(carboxyamino)imidazole ribonucleotide mutase